MLDPRKTEFLGTILFLYLVVVLIIIYFCLAQDTFLVYVAVPVHVASIEPSVPPKQDASEAVPAIEQGSIMEQSVVPVPPV